MSKREMPNPKTYYINRENKDEIPGSYCNPTAVGALKKFTRPATSVESVEEIRKSVIEEIKDYCHEAGHREVYDALDEYLDKNYRDHTKQEE